MLKRIASTGVNLVVLGVSVAVFLIAFFALSALGASGRPPTVSVLAAAHDLNIGDVIAPGDMAVKTVFQDENAAHYIPADQVTQVVSGVVAQPIFKDQPIFRTAIVAAAGEGTRLSAALAKFPGYSLFPLPLDAMNLVAPEAEAFLPGDLVGITVVVSSRPQQITTPTAMPDVIVSSDYEAQATATPLAEESARVEALGRSQPPLAKDLFPEGVRVIAVEGLPQAADATDGSDTGSSFDGLNQSHILMLLVPNASREELSLALQQGDQLVVSLIAQGDDAPTPGFTYWDFEDLFKTDREKALGGGQ